VNHGKNTSCLFIHESASAWNNPTEIDLDYFWCFRQQNAFYLAKSNKIADGLQHVLEDITC
jgi:hypothetical protein